MDTRRKSFLTLLYRFGLLWLAILTLTGCGYNEIQKSHEEVKAAGAEIFNQYQRRADLIPNLVKTTKSYMTHEKQLLTELTRIRAEIQKTPLNPDLLENPETAKRYLASQGELSSALTKLVAVSENYPDLKSSQLFQDLMVQLEGTENRIAVARGRYIRSVQNYNTVIRTFPNNITARLFFYEPKTQLEPENSADISKPPEVNFE